MLYLKAMNKWQSFDFNMVLPIKILDSFNVHQRLTLHVNHVTGCCEMKDKTMLPSKYEVLWQWSLLLLVICWLVVEQALEEHGLPYENGLHLGRVYGLGSN